ncbi:hypothetical protein A3B35_02660 [Candidatus Kaiserbacteria bacterium RIFCSPLOWO2_01_FULL_54_24]|uniref:Uncharacterized protein n=1 Tax=Candidatus Kaiserbacteria bacterium RIFCSPLOWO2_01_FULL_54_24 TaxID=1798515 RepID=A0A1F6EU78_9BACT|nr:MAG: hypothetical protein A3B35_02660 [Candidatus Kaiserbacteria bacterium RIFCSPLOWO2_01_FULL_54_24]
MRAEWPYELQPIETFVPRERFVETVSDEEALWIADIDPKLKKVLDTAATEQSLPKTLLQVATLAGKALPPSESIVEDLNLLHLVAYGNIHQMLSMQPRGGKGRLLANGWGGFAPVAILGGVVHLMSMQYYDKQAITDSPKYRTMSHQRNGWVLGLVSITDGNIRRGERICYHFA